MSDLIDREALLRQIDIDSEGEPGYYGDTWKFIDTIKRMPSALSTNLAEVGTDCISRQVAIDFVDAGHLVNPNEPRWSDNEVVNFLKSRPSAQPEITEEQAIEHLQSTGWMQTHDKEMYEMGLREKLADDSDSYDALLPSAQPDIIQCRNCKFASGDSRICMKFGHSPIGELDFCAWAERRTDG